MATMVTQLRRRLGPTYRDWRTRLDHPDLKEARLLIETLRSKPVDVLHLGASESLFISPHDEDTRTLSQMLRDGLAPDLSLHSIAGAGHNPELQKMYVDILACSPQRPILIMFLPLRFGFPPWRLHPDHSHIRPMKALRRIPPQSPPWRFHAYVPPSKKSDFTRFNQIEFRTLDGTASIGELRGQWRHPEQFGLTPEEHIRRTFSFLHGGIDPLTPAFLKTITDLAGRARDLGLPVVAYQPPMPIQRGTEVLGDALLELVIREYKAMDDAFIAGYGPSPILRIGRSFETDEFIDPDDGVEHYSERGRKHLTELLVEAVHNLRGATPSP